MRACVHVRMCAYMCVLKASLVVSYHVLYSKRRRRKHSNPVVNPFYTDTRYNDNIRYNNNVRNLTGTKPSLKRRESIRNTARILDLIPREIYVLYIFIRIASPLRRLQLIPKIYVL